MAKIKALISMMRTKEQIFKAQVEDIELCNTEYDRRTLQHQLTLEVLIDIRDILDNFRETQKYFLTQMAEKD